MKVYYFPEHKLHNLKYHPENADRIESIVNELNVIKIEKPKIYEEKIKEVHNENYLKKLKELSENTKDYRFLDVDNYVTSHTYEVSLMAASLYFNVERSPHEFFLIRPPGHHAKRDKFSGFCYINNVLVAARSEKNVLILDLDYHFGDGTYYNLKDHEYFVSIHRFGVFPGTGHYLDSTNNKFLIPLDFSLVNDKEFHYIFEKILYDLIDDINPNRIFVSMGFDGYYGDPIGDWRLEKVWQEIFYNLRNYKISLFLEGGYNPMGILEGIKYIEKGLKGEPTKLEGDIRRAFKYDIDELAKYFKKYLL